MVTIEITYNSDDHNGGFIQEVLERFAFRSDVDCDDMNWRTLHWGATFYAPDKKSARKFISKIKNSRSKHLLDINLKITTTTEE